MTDGASREARLQELRPFVVQARVMQGWTFAYEAVPLGPPAPWDYEGRARELVRDAASVLDMGTGGGEVFERILAGQRGQVAATEGWAPNVPVAAQRLRRLGVSVVHALIHRPNRTGRSVGNLKCQPNRAESGIRSKERLGGRHAPWPLLVGGPYASIRSASPPPPESPTFGAGVLCGQ